MLVDLISWRAVFLFSAALAVATALLLGSAPESRAERASPSIRPFPALLIVTLLAGLSVLLINGGHDGSWRSPSSLAAAIAVALSALALWRYHQLTPVLPRELLCSVNCISANAATFVLYFGVFGLSFLLVIYTQAVLDYSATWSAVTVLPTALAILVLAEPFGRAGAWIGARTLVMAAPLAAAAGVLWIGMGPHPLPFWTHIVTGAALFGLGVAMAVSPLTHAAISSVPEESAGTASGVHHATVRASGLAAVALLGSLAAAGDAVGALTVDGFRRALLVCAAVIAVAGVLAGSRIIDEAPGGLPRPAKDSPGQ
jgi:MFS family permease